MGFVSVLGGWVALPLLDPGPALPPTAPLLLLLSEDPRRAHRHRPAAACSSFHTNIHAPTVLSGAGAESPGGVTAEKAGPSPAGVALGLGQHQGCSGAASWCSGSVLREKNGKF